LGSKKKSLLLAKACTKFVILREKREANVAKKFNTPSTNVVNVLQKKKKKTCFNFISGKCFGMREIKPNIYEHAMVRLIKHFARTETKKRERETLASGF